MTLVQGFGWTLAASACAWIIALCWARSRHHPHDRAPAVRFGNAWVEFFRNIPLLVQMFLWYFVIPEFMPPLRSRDQATAATRIRVRRALLGLFHLGAHRRAGARRHPDRCHGASACRHGARPHPAAGLSLRAAADGVSHHHPTADAETMNLIKNSSIALTIGLAELTFRARELRNTPSIFSKRSRRRR